MKSQIFFVIPREEERYKICYEYGNKIWNNKLWFVKKEFKEIFLHYRQLVDDQRKKYLEISQINKEFLKILLEELKEAIEGGDKKNRAEKELQSKLEEKLREIKRLKEEIKRKAEIKKPTEKPEEKKKPKQEIDNEEVRKKLFELKAVKKIIKEKLARFEKPEENLLKKKKELEEILTEKLVEIKSLNRINELEKEWNELEEKYNDSKKLYSTFDNEVIPQIKGQTNWFLEKMKAEPHLSFRNYKYTYLKWIEKVPGAWKVKDNVYSEWQAREKLPEKHDIFLFGEGLARKKITFNYRIPDNITINLNNFLFNYNGVWYEVEDYKQVDWDRVEVYANYSYYWNDYRYCLNANANGIIHNYPIPLHEICACPDFTQDEVRVKNIFVVTNYELKWDLWKAYGHKRKESNWYLLWLNGEKGKVKSSDNLDFPWIKLGDWKKVDWSEGEGRDFVWYLLGENNAEEDVAEGKNEQLFSLVSQRVEKPGKTSKEYFMNLEAWTDVEITGSADKMEMKRGNSAKEFANWIGTEYPSEIHHCQVNHIESSIQWRDKAIWKGNLNDIQDKDKNSGKEKLCLSMMETSNPSGTVISFYDKYGKFIAQVHESIFIKIGKADESNVILQTIITMGVVAAAATATGGAALALGGSAAGGTMAWGTVGMTAAKAGLGALAAGVKGRLINHGETIREEFTVDEFEHKFLRSGHNPVKIVLEHDREVINRYWANKTIKKGGETNTYFNAANFGAYLSKTGFVKFHFHTLNMRSYIESEESKQWFKDNLQTGVQLIDGDPVPWYQTELPKSNLESTGANVSGDSDTLDGGDEVLAESKRPKGSNYHQRGHYFIFYEDGSQEHWMALYPRFDNNQLADGHAHGAFILEFSKPVRKMVDIYTCIGCGAQNTPLFDALHSNYRSSNSDSWDTIYKGKPFEPWFTEMGRATPSEYHLTVNGVAGRLGGSGDVWEKDTQEVPSGEPFTKAYGFVSGDVITWRLTKKSKPTKMIGEGGFPDGWGLPPSAWVPSGGGLVPEATEPNIEPDINPPEPIIEPTEALIDGTELQVEPEEEPEDPEPEQEPEDDDEPEDPEPEPEDEPNTEDTPEVEPRERTKEDDDEAGI